MLFQSTIAILILVGFESSTALAAEAKNPKRDIPRGVILSLVIQGLFAYLFQYFAANYALGELARRGQRYRGGSGVRRADWRHGKGVWRRTIGRFRIRLHDRCLPSTVALAILGTTLAAMNTGVRISFAMAQDEEMPEIMGLLHGRYATPYMGIVIMVIVSAIIGSIGVAGGVTYLTGITLASNLGTFILYGLICALTAIAFLGRPEFNILKHGIIPVLGFIVNVIMVLAIFVIGIQSGGATAEATYMALALSGAWLVVSLAYFVISSRQRGKHIVPPVSAVKGTTGGG